MHLTRHLTSRGAKWALDGRYLPFTFSLDLLLAVQKGKVVSFLNALPRGMAATDPLLAPVEDEHEVWASGVTYMRSREARKTESKLADVYERVYDALRPELFLKALGWRVAGDGETVYIRRDSNWNVPEPELVLVLNACMEVVGFTIGNDMSSRSIEGENPLYLPQAKVYNQSCGLGPSIYLPSSLTEIETFNIKIAIIRNGNIIFEGSTSTREMKRSFQDLVNCLGQELDFPRGTFLMTGTGIVPHDDFTLCDGDDVSITINPIGCLTNRVSLSAPTSVQT